MVEALGNVLHVVGPAQLDAAIRAEDVRVAESLAPPPPDMSGLAGHLHSQLDMMKRHRESASGWSHRMLHALQVFNGQYDAAKLSQIRNFGGSDVYARIIAMKCRGASALLRDVYLSPDRPWGLDASDDPPVPPEVLETVSQLVQLESQESEALGAPIEIEAIRDRTRQLIEAARQAAKKKAEDGARIAEDRLDEHLKLGGFYKALAEFITDLPLFPFACLKGPVVRILPTVTWEGNEVHVQQVPRLTWSRISPFDVWWTPGVSDIEDAAVIERTRLTRADLNDLLDLPGYNQDAVRAVLDEYGRGGLTGIPDSTESERARQESRESPLTNDSGLIECYEFTGNVQGRYLLETGMDPEKVQDPLRDYFVQVWLIGRHVIKAQLAPSPRRRHPYFITSFEKVPGTPVGNGLPDILSDIQDAGNAVFRSLINNLSIASGPQVVVNNDRLASGEDGETMYPWKRWHVMSDPMGNNTVPPIAFFQPQSNAQELLTVYERLVNMADELSAIPKYLSGAGTTSGAGRTASGLAMLMGNASKILQTVAANIDRDVLEPLLSMLFEMVMLTDSTGTLSGKEKVRVLGVAVAVQKETQRARQLEFLQITANPIDAQIVGPKGRAEILRSVADTIGMPGSRIVPREEELEQQEQQAEVLAQAGGMPGFSGMGQTGADPTGAQAMPGGTGDMGPRTNISGG